MTPLPTQSAYTLAGFNRLGISLDRVQTDPTLRAILRCAERADQRRQRRAQAAMQAATHNKGAPRE